MKYKGMKSLKRILLAIIIVSSIMAISASAKDNSITDIGSALATITGNDNVVYWFTYSIQNDGYNLQHVVDGSCPSSQTNPCGIIINYNLS